ncbi:ABC transporter ATP-binding protein [Celeribacter sp. ULVN23_4]
MMRLFLGLLGEDVVTFRRYAMMALASGVLNALTIALTVPGLSYLLQGETAAAWPWLMALVICGLGCWMARRVVERAGIQVGIAVLEGMRLRLGAHVARLPVGWFSARTTGKLTHALTQGVMEVAQLPAHVFTPVLSGLVVPPVLVLVLFVLAPDIGIVTLIALPVMGLAAALSARLGQRADAGYQSAAAETGQRAIEFARTQSVLRAFSGEGGSARHLAAAFDEQRDAARHLIRLSTASSVLNGWMTQVLFAAVLVIVLAQLNTGLTPDQTLSLILALILAQRFMEPMTELAGYGEALRAARGHLEALHEIAEVPPLPQAATPRSPEDATIRLEHVGFRYTPNSASVLDGLTLTVPEGSMTALIGASGSGKSTVARLIARFYDVGEGRIEIGGVDLRDMSEETLAAQVSQIFQDTYLVSGTIGENIRMGRADATEAELAEVIAQAGIDEILARLPEGLETEVGEGGVRLSGGERQRITIARALLKAAPILLVDEATAALDAENQAVIAQTLHHMRGKCTMVVIAHQLSTVQMADQIAVLEGGKIVECGTPADLATRSGPYARFLAQRKEASGWRITPAG